MSELYREPVDEKFDDITQAALGELELDDKSDLKAESSVGRQSEDNHVEMTEGSKADNTINT